jgi:cell division protein FtsL
LVTTRILARRRLATSPPRRHAAPQRPFSRPLLEELRTRAYALQQRLGALGRIYVLGAVVLALTVAYLAVSATATQTSYELGQLQDQNHRLSAERDQLRYREATLHTPSRVDGAAHRQGLTRPRAYTYVHGQRATIDLNAPIGKGRPDERPLWKQVAGGVALRVTGTTLPGGARGS